MFSRRCFALLLAASLVACVPVARPGVAAASVATAPPYYPDQQLRTEDYVYDDNIRTVLLYPQNPDLANQSAAALRPPVLPIEQGLPLTLEFDELGEEAHVFHAKIFHCNADWTVSILNEIQYLNEYNDYLFTNYQLSAGTKVPYTHFRLDLPRVKLPGNYVLVVHREGNVKDLSLTRRFMVYDNSVDIAAKVTFSTGIQERTTNQQVDFSINYRNYPLTNPLEEVKVVLRQNYRWDNAITTLKPLNVRDNDKVLEYNYFGLENNFAGGNEFRFFDARSIRTTGTNVARLSISQTPVEVLVRPDQPRAGQTFAQADDFNGMYVVDNRETGVGSTEADYVNVVFTLMSSPVAGEVFVNGKFNDWQLNNRNRMTYDTEAQAYRARMLLKMGIYNYDYAVLASSAAARNETLLEGSYFNTENTYEVLAYLRPIGSRADLLVGYRVLYHNAR